MLAPRFRFDLRMQMTLVAVASLLASAVALVFNPPRPRVVVEDPVVQFGTLRQHAEWRRSWVVRNEGYGPLWFRLAGFHGCTGSVDLDSREWTILSPGGKRMVEIQWWTKRYIGPQRVGVAIVTNDPETPRFELMGEGIVRPSDAFATHH